MSAPVRAWIAAWVLGFVGVAVLRPAAAAAAPGDQAQVAPVAPPAGYPAYPPPGYVPYPPPYPGYPPPPQLVAVHRARRGLVVGGAVTFLVSWSIAATVSYLLINETDCTGSCRAAKNYLWIPVVGPAVVGASGSSDPGVFYLWSAAEAAGVAMFVVGVMGHDVMEYRYARGGPTLRLAPLLARDASGMALTARW